MTTAPTTSAGATKRTEWDWNRKLDKLQRRFDAYKDKPAPDPDASDYDSQEEEEEKDVLWDILRSACKLVNMGQATKHSDTPQIVQQVQALINKVVELSIKKHFGYNGLRSFADRPDTLVEDSMHSFMGHPSGDRLADAMSNFMSFFGLPASPPSGRTILPWTKQQQPHPGSTRLSRFRTGVELPSYTERPLATAVLQARCEVYDAAICQPIRMALSDSGECLAVAAHAGYKSRDPMLLYWLPNEGPNPEQNSVEPPLIEPGLNIVLDDTRKLMFVEDIDRVKSFSWADKSGDPVHTLNSFRSHRGPLALLPNGRLIRGGEGSALCWTLDELETHGPDYRRIGAGVYRWDNCLRSLPSDEDEEHSTGSRPSTRITFADRGFFPRIFHLHQPSGHLLVGEDPNRGHACVELDMDHGGAVAGRYLGHAATVADFSTSEGDANVFLTASADGYARLYDRRQPLPVLTFDVEKREGPLFAAMLVHVDGLPIMFSGGRKTEGIKCWDIRAKKCIYELSTGNTSVEGLAWSSAQSTLYAATSTSYQDWIGNHFSYRDCKVPSGTDILPPKKMHNNLYWPDRAIHVENAFGYVYDAGTHVMLRYSFKEQPEPDILPIYGDARPLSEDDWF
ncbi:uncharacterized protein C8Q71DRAFT_750419 [Rhodofomes roseus]|uniref:WD40 repeat protein n=1 Tax=Rhodofomes roseus TaxID=34475 RepID=A0ABQ8KL63_9APHY|nr:uncharacterized protein C8Q71DRAFT_750419 [Rhodofomes roseus]KAH9838317.1 hypothetical protein C8Q71DRAFT_750419 [Rhodofomes roseus]